MPSFHSDELCRFVTRIFEAAGAPAADARAVAESLVESNLRGHDSHGVTLAGWYLSQIQSRELIPGAPFTVHRQTPSLVAADGGLGFGQVQCRALVDAVAHKARETGAACGAMVRCGHVGRLGEWVERLAERGLAGLIAVNDNGVVRTVAPPGGIEPRISTNPIAIGLPTPEGPLVLDISTSAVANGKLKIARLAKSRVPWGWIQDAQGNPTTDPQVMLADPPGALLPFGGDQSYKGFGLGMMFDILVAGLAGGWCPPAAPGTQEWNNVLLVVWDPRGFAGAAHFAGEAHKLMNFVRGTRTRPSVERIRLPGERSAATRAKRLETGIPLDEAYLEPLFRLAAGLQVPLPAPLKAAPAGI